MAKRSKALNSAAFLLITVVLFAVDQLSKAWALKSLEPYAGKPFIGEFLKFYLVWNDSAAFSISLGATWVFTIVSSLASVVIVYLLLTKAKATSWKLTLAVLLSGVVGNLSDRLFRAPGFPIGKVVDFLQLPFNFPVFNVADICISGSMTVIVILVMRGIKLSS